MAVSGGMASNSFSGTLDRNISKVVHDNSERRPTSPLSTLSGAVSPGLCGDVVLSPKIPIPGHHGSKLPREGIKGGGMIRMSNRGLFEGVKDEMEFLALAESPPEGLKRTEARRPSTGNQTGVTTHSRSKTSSKSDAMRSTGGSGAAASDITPRSGFAKDKKTAPKLTQEERKRAEIFSKWEKIEALRDRDRKEILEKVEHGQQWRDERFSRLLEAVTGRDNLAYKTALALRERDSHDERRRRDLHAAWDEKVHQPLVSQAHGRLNPPDRAVQQKLMGSKSVDFQMPGEVFKLLANVSEDPARKPVVDHARENAFHHAATSVLRNSHSAPDMLKRQQPVPQPATNHSIGGSSGSVVPRATTRPVFEPTNWGQRDIQGTMFGHFAQVAEQGPGFKRAIRGGTDMHIPDASDDVLVAGSRHSRTQGHGDVGILRGDTAAQGESSNYKSFHGASSAAPAQDHFTYETGTRITNLEFPLGKKIFPEFH